MWNIIAWNLAALFALIPVALLPLRRNAGRDLPYWASLVLAIVVPLGWALGQLSDGWQTSLSVDLWVGIAGSMVVFGLIAAINRQAWRLTPLLVPYMILLGLLAVLFAFVPAEPLTEAMPEAWLDLHILVSMVTLACLTVAATAALASFLQARALKLKRPTRLSRFLPAVTESERLFERLLIVSELILAIGVVSGLAMKKAGTGSVFTFDHKSLFGMIAFVIIGLLLIGRRVCGVRGQMAARVVLMAYTFVVLGYFGMKFVHQVLLS
ncbi:cytochrome C assembly family protein [Telmatospirillum siberiense]|uniref:Cytochrome c assembly protein domain-containing protein n=1 Tax=Telmatospirillum siberiense TaxID=382514 RepID=A0A2N3PYX7_9PROT|nr:cytochrome c biogenesis protein CcsA [Telmatospirillum siberiense]PKU25585.1 hypothetical protein CWS72_05860 [Telmatospirillum siberiense]